MKKIIFLDIDGVIATPQSIDESGLWTFTKDCLDLLGVILKETGAKIVISSSWRLHNVEETKEHFAEHNFPFCDDIIGVTIRAYHYIVSGEDSKRPHLSIPRGVEIKQWLDTNIYSDNGKDWNMKMPGVDFTYVILDDDTDMLLEQKDYYLRTKSRIGLTEEIAKKAIQILNQNNEK